MVLVKMTTFVVSNILHSLISMQKSLFVSNCRRKQNQEKCLPDLKFILVVLSEFAISFA